MSDFFAGMTVGGGRPGGAARRLRRYGCLWMAVCLGAVAVPQAAAAVTDRRRAPAAIPTPKFDTNGMPLDGCCCRRVIRGSPPNQVSRLSPRRPLRQEGRPSRDGRQVRHAIGGTGTGHGG